MKKRILTAVIPAIILLPLLLLPQHSETVSEYARMVEAARENARRSQPVISGNPEARSGLHHDFLIPSQPAK